MANEPVSASWFSLRSILGRPRGVLTRPSAKVRASSQTNMFIHKEEDTTEMPMPSLNVSVKTRLSIWVGDIFKESDSFNLHLYIPRSFPTSSCDIANRNFKWYLMVLVVVVMISWINYCLFLYFIKPNVAQRRRPWRRRLRQVESQRLTMEIRFWLFEFRATKL